MALADPTVLGPRPMRALAIVLSVCGTGIGCTRRAADQQSVCQPFAIAASVQDSLGGDSASALADLDCDGRRERVTVGWDTTSGVTRPRIDVAGSLPAHLILEMDGLPDIAAFGDLDGDGLRDVLLVSTDESSILPVVLLTRGRQLVPAEADTTVNWRRLQITRDPALGADTCLSRYLPSFVATSGRVSGLSVASMTADGPTCTAAELVYLVMRDGKLSRADRSPRH